jgi:hypothetical protein
VTKDYSEAGLVVDVTDLSFSEMLTLQNWLSFYEKNYIFVGRVIGRFYGEDRLPTLELTQVEAMMTKAWRQINRNRKTSRSSLHAMLSDVPTRAASSGVPQRVEV